MIGVLSTSPTGPQIHVQNTAATSRATGETPAEWPNSSGSITLAVVRSRITNVANTAIGWAHPGLMAKLSTIGPEAAIHVPMYGTNRSRAVTNPHRNAYSTPMTSNASPNTTPNAAFTHSWASSSLLTRLAASTVTRVVPARRVWPSRPIIRFRSSSRWIRM